jgi:thioredoxin reductase
MEETSVLIVGAGPTGLALAVTLGRADIKVYSRYGCHSLRLIVL